MEKSIQVLLVDDEQEFLDGVSERMKLKGFEPVMVNSGEEALEKAKTMTFDAAVVDLKMPGMDGLVTITKLKEIQPNLKTVLLTGFGDAKVKEATEGLESAYFEKSEMGGFWGFIKSLPDMLENSMASAGLAEEGDRESAERMMKKK